MADEKVREAIATLRRYAQAGLIGADQLSEIEALCAKARRKIAPKGPPKRPPTLLDHNTSVGSLWAYLRPPGIPFMPTWRDLGIALEWRPWLLAHVEPGMVPGLGPGRVQIIRERFQHD